MRLSKFDLKSIIYEVIWLKAEELVSFLTSERHFINYASIENQIKIRSDNTFERSD